jgi:DNA-directed RNA polymerase specialized sigma24 family protein
MQRLLRRVTQRYLPSEQLIAIQELRAELDRIERQAVLDLREAGVSWEDIARTIGITRQALTKRAHSW